jgi:hypothetical protein
MEPMSRIAMVSHRFQSATKRRSASLIFSHRSLARVYASAASVDPSPFAVSEDRPAPSCRAISCWSRSSVSGKEPSNDRPRPKCAIASKWADRDAASWPALSHCATARSVSAAPVK